MDTAWILALQAFVCGMLGAILIRLVEAGWKKWRAGPDVAFPVEPDRWPDCPAENTVVDPSAFLPPVSARAVGLYGRRPGLTLIEVITVIALITVLMTLTAAMGQYMVRQSAYRTSEDILSSLDRATAEYKNDTGIWPYQFDSNGDGAPDNSTQTAVHELTRKDKGKGYFEGGPQTLPIRDPFTSNRVVYNPTTRGFYQVFTPFEDRGREWYDRPSNTSGWSWDDGVAVDVHGFDTGDWRVQRNHQRPFWHSGGPNQGRREGYGILDQGNCDDIYSSCFAF